MTNVSELLPPVGRRTWYMGDKIGERRETKTEERREKREEREEREKREEKRQGNTQTRSIASSNKNPFRHSSSIWYSGLFDFGAMGKTSWKKQKNSGDSTLNESSSTARDDAASASLATNVTGSAPNTVGDDRGETETNAHESKVWKYAIKVGSEKARCNLCQVGKIWRNTLRSYVLIITLESRQCHNSMA